MPEDRDSYSFLTRVAELLTGHRARSPGAAPLAGHPQLRDGGATKSLAFRLGGRRVEVHHGHEFAIDAGLSLPRFPASVTVSFAPRGLYARAKYLEHLADPSAHPTTGCEPFDRLFVVLGEEHEVAAAGLSAALPAMVDAALLRPSLGQFKLGSGGVPEFWLHLSTRPKADGDERWDPQHAVAAMHQTLALVATVEQVWANR